MNKRNRLNRIESLESTIDTCLCEIGMLIPDLYLHPWFRIQDDIQDEMASLEAEIDFEEYELSQK